MHKILKSALFATAAMVAVSATPASAAIVGAVGGTINSGGPGFGTLTETFNQAGLSATYTSGVTDFDTFVGSTTHTYLFAGYEWFSNSGTTSAAVTYDLGSSKTINKMALWNEESSGIGLLDLSVSLDGIVFASLAAGLTPTDNANSVTSYGADVFSFVATAFRYIRLDMSRCPQPDGDFPSCSIGEVAFNQVSAVPVPAALPLLATALGALGFVARRRKAA